jgi:hypothetical protein
MANHTQMDVSTERIGQARLMAHKRSRGSLCPAEGVWFETGDASPRTRQAAPRVRPDPRAVPMHEEAESRESLLTGIVPLCRA